jgi:hypothetical protein
MSSDAAASTAEKRTEQMVLRGACRDCRGA